MKTAKLFNQKFEIVEEPDIHLPKDKRGAIIKVRACGLCGSDLVKLFTGSVPDGTVLGHEVVGEIVEINTTTDFQEGDRVVLGHHVPCFSCDYCRGENYSMCKHFKSTNIRPGGFSQYIFVSEAHLVNTVFRVSNLISDEQAVFTEPVACCLRAVKRLKLTRGSKVLVIGLGSIGILTGQLLKIYGYEPYGIDIIQDRLDFATNYPFEAIFEADSKDLAKEVCGFVTYGFDGIFICAGSDSSVDLAKKLVRNGGTILVFSSAKTDIGYLHNEIYYRELTVLSSYSAAPQDLEEAYKLIETREVDVEGISTVYPFENINQALDDTVKNNIMKACIRL